MTDTRTRTRNRTNTATEMEEVREGGRAMHTSGNEEHKPTRSQQTFMIEGALFARVSLRDGLTLNTGNYNSFRREVGLEIDVLLDKNPEGFTGELSERHHEKLDRLYQQMEEWVGDRVAESQEAATDYMDQD